MTFKVEDLVQVSSEAMFHANKKGYVVGISKLNPNMISLRSKECKALLFAVDIKDVELTNE